MRPQLALFLACVLVMCAACSSTSSSGVSAEASTLTGVVTYRPRIALPPRSEVIVRLLDVSRADAAAPTLAEQRILTDGEVEVWTRGNEALLRVNDQEYLGCSGQLQG